MKFDNLRDELMNDITQTDTFQLQLIESARVSAAADEFYSIVNAIRQHSEELADQIENIVNTYAAAYTDEGVLYGMRCYGALIGTK